MKTILLPLNLKANTLALVNYAVPIAARSNATVVLLHVVPKQSYDNGTFSPETDVHQRVKQEAEIILDQLSRQMLSQGVRCKVLVEDGNAGDQIVKCAKSRQVDLIVMHRACGHEACSSAKVLQAAPCPVLTWTEALAAKG